MLHQYRSAVALNGRHQLIAQHLHRSLQMPEPEWCLGHMQDGCAVQRRRAIGRFLGVQLQLEVEKAPQPLIVTATAQPQQIGDGQTCEQSRCQRCGPKGPQQCAEIPEGARRHHRVLAGELPVAGMQLMAKAPEALAAWELTLTLGGPGVRVMPERNGRGAIAQVDHTTWVQKLCAGQRHVQMLQQSRMTASGLQSSHLGRPNIEHPWTTPECSRTSPRLLMRFQQRDLDAIAGQECRCG